jgi:inorganic pyrophosphatase
MHAVEGFILATGFISLLFAIFQFLQVKKIAVESRAPSEDGQLRAEDGVNHGEITRRLKVVYEAIYTGADSFLFAEYSICGIFMVVFSLIILFLISWGSGKADNSMDWKQGALTALSFLVGATTSIISGYLGMKVAVYSNARTTVSAQAGGWTAAFNTAFQAGSVMGYALCGLGLLVLYFLLAIYRTMYSEETEWAELMEAIAGYGLGGSSIAMFGRVGGGIYTKAADVGADLVGKVVHGIPEDDPRNPATIADNVGDNVGDVAGMGADLFGSFAESTCAALVIAASAYSVVEGNALTGTTTLVSEGFDTLLFPLAISGAGILVCLVCSFIATHIQTVKEEAHVERSLKMQLISTTLLMTPVIYAIASWVLPEEFNMLRVNGSLVTGSPAKAFACVAMGVWGGLIIGLITEYYTSHSYAPVREVANSCTTGAATNIIYGLALGYKSAIIPVSVLSAVIYGSFSLIDMYGVALAGIGMLSTLATGLSIDVYGPVCDNAGGIAEMAGFPDYVREKTDALDAAGNTTAAIGKGFAIGSAALVSLALFGAFVTRVQDLNSQQYADEVVLVTVNVLDPITFAGLMMGAMLPYWFSAMTMKSVGIAAMAMVQEVERQFNERPALLDENSGLTPDYEACVRISTQASLREMVLPAMLVMLAPIVTGTFFGTNAVFGLLAGGLTSGVQMAISSSNTGGAWDNAKKYIEKASPDSELQGKGSEVHKAAVVGDTVGDPLKDTSGPALNILMKLMAIISLVFVDYFFAIDNGRGVFQISNAYIQN